MADGLQEPVTGHHVVEICPPPSLSLSFPKSPLSYRQKKKAGSKAQVENRAGSGSKAQVAE